MPASPSLPSTTHILLTKYNPPRNSMSSIPTTIFSQSNFEPLFKAALADYTRRTGQDLRNHPLACVIDRCNSPDAILAIFQEQSRGFDEFRKGNSQLFKWLKPIVNGLHIISTNATLSAGASLAFPPANIVFYGIGVLLSTAKYVRQSYNTLVDIFECIESFTSRLKIYAEIQPTAAMTETVIKIMVELLSVLALATKEMNRGKLKKYAKTLLGENKVEAVLQRLDRLTLEESKMTAAQTLDIVSGLVKNMEAVMEDGKTSTDDIRQALVLMQEIAMEANKMKHSQLHRNFQRWLSPPDPWLNHNLARLAHHSGTATWFTQGKTFAQWKATGSLLWVNGIPGSGKTIISSSIIEELDGMCRTGLGTLAIFYCDFRDDNKQNARNLLSSILIQFSHRSDAFSQILSSLYSTYSDGSREPSIDALLGCLKRMLALRGQGTLYIVVDALDECPNSSGLPTQREQVLKVVKELVDLKLPHFHFCMTSRPEIDIRRVLEPLSRYNVLLHNQRGQIEDLAKYIGSVVYSDETMQDWSDDLKKLVIETLTDKGASMFRWAYCQLEILRRCPLRDIPSVINELPETLNETYERILKDIPKKLQKDAHRIFQWLTVSSRPPRVEELAEVFALNFDAETSGIPKFDPSWRPRNAEASVLSTCSTLISIVRITDWRNDIWDEKVVQFAHVSVKEYLTSGRITNLEPVSHFHVLHNRAHTLLAKACLSILSRLDYSLDDAKIRNFPLARYAAKCWVDHARFEDVSSNIQYGVDSLFDRDKPHLAAWIWLYDAETSRERYDRPLHPTQPEAVPLYYAALCGIRNLVERILSVYPQDVNARGGYYETPLHAAVVFRHLDIILLLLDHGADAESRGRLSQTALYMASSAGYADGVRALIDHGADPNAECDDWDNDWDEDAKFTPLLVALKNGRLEIARMLLESVRSGANVEIRGGFYGHSALYMASSRGYAEVVRSLIDHGADLNAECSDWDKGGNDVKFTPLLVASQNERQEVSRVLLVQGADVNHQADGTGRSSLHYATRNGSSDIVGLLLDHGANPNTSDSACETALHDASLKGHVAVVTLLLEYGADVNARDKSGWTPLHNAAYGRHLEVVRLLLNHGSDVNARKDDHWTALHLAANKGHLQVVEFLLERGGDPHARTDKGENPLQMASRRKHTQIKRLLSELTGERM